MKMRKLLVVLMVLGMTLALLAVAGGLSAIAHHDDDNGGRSEVFTLRDLRGCFGFSFQGSISDPDSDSFLPVAATGRLEIDGKGNIKRASRTINIGGLEVQQTFKCKLTLKYDGTGSAECPLDNPLPPPAPETETFDFVLVDGANGFQFVGTTPGIVVLGTGIRQ